MPLTITEEMIKQDPFFEMGLERGKELGLKEGERRAKRILIEKLLKKGMNIEKISALLDIPIEEIKQLLGKNKESR